MTKELSIKDIIAKNITCLRKREGMTQAELANRLNYSDKAISKWERGESLPDAEMLYNISILFNVRIEYLFQDHNYAGLSLAETQKLEKKEKRTKVVIALTILAILLTLIGIFFTSLSKIFHLGSNINFILLFIPIIPIIFLIINSILGQVKFNFLLESLIIWSSAISLYIYLSDYNFIIIIPIAAFIQITLLLFPKISQFYAKKYTAKENEDKRKKKELRNSKNQKKQ